MLTSAWVLYGFDTAGGLAEETVNPTREVPRAMIAAITITAAISTFWLLSMVLAIPNVSKVVSPDIAANPGTIKYIFDAHFPGWVTNAFLISVCLAIFVCCLAIQAATTRLLFAYGRDKMIPGHKFFGYVHPRTRTPLTSAIVIAVLVVILLVIVDKTGGLPIQMIGRITTYATVGTYIAYLMVTLGAASARSKGWPRDRAYFNLGGWGWTVNIIAIVYGGLMIINLAWPRPTVGVAWYDKWNAWISIVVVFVSGAIVYMIQRARGVDLSATIHEIELPGADREAAEALAAGEAGKVIPPGAG